MCEGLALLIIEDFEDRITPAVGDLSADLVGLPAPLEGAHVVKVTESTNPTSSQQVDDTTGDPSLLPLVPHFG